MVFTLLPFQGAPEPKEKETLKKAMQCILEHLHEKHTAAAHKDRVDLDQLNQRYKSNYLQTIALPDALYAEIKTLLQLEPIILLPPNQEKLTVARADAVLLLVDGNAELKGLPSNKTATMLAAACGLKRIMHGDCFVMRIRKNGTNLALGGECPPQMLAERDWLEAAQDARRCERIDDCMTADVSMLVRAEIQHFKNTYSESVQTSPSLAKPFAHKLSWSDGTQGPTVEGASVESAVTIRVDGLDASVKARNVKVDIKEQWLKLLIGDTVIVEGKLFQKVETEDSTWQFEDTKDGMRALVVTLEKREKMRWLQLTRCD